MERVFKLWQYDLFRQADYLIMRVDFVSCCI